MKIPNFVIGIGSQRAGSTLLHKILDESTSIYMHPVKELHYFDTLHHVRSEKALKQFSLQQLEREINRLAGTAKVPIHTKRYKNYLRTNFLLSYKKISDIEYMDLYRPCLMGRNMVGEVTPEYMILPEEGVRHLSEVVGNDAKIVLMVRNPVRRLVSAFKLLNAYHGLQIQSEDAERELMQHVADDTGWLKAQDRYNDYESAISLYRRYFGDILCLRYDEVVERPQIFKKRLEDYLGQTLNNEKFSALTSKRINQIGENIDLSEEAEKVLCSRYEKQTMYIQRLFDHDEALVL
ncbi:MAG: sulfotransferase [Gammaproteobacteria bacterium]